MVVIYVIDIGNNSSQINVISMDQFMKNCHFVTDSETNPGFSSCCNDRRVRSGGGGAD